MTLFHDMELKDTKRNPVFTAIETLKEPEEIRRFMKEYEEYMIENSNESTKGKEAEVARSNVGYILGYYADETRKRWYGILQEVSHPVFGSGFGRGKDPSSKEAFEMGKKLGKAVSANRAKKEN